MPTVFVHGVPETAALWDALRAKLDREDSVALSLPGFGCARPAGVSATKEAYVDWLIRELEKLPRRSSL
jgi:pimeloyl-ACP methyl ester carboxylesterase